MKKLLLLLVVLLGLQLNSYADSEKSKEEIIIEAIQNDLDVRQKILAQSDMLRMQISESLDIEEDKVSLLNTSVIKYLLKYVASEEAEEMAKNDALQILYGDNDIEPLNELNTINNPK